MKIALSSIAVFLSLGDTYVVGWAQKSQRAASLSVHDGDAEEQSDRADDNQHLSTTASVNRRRALHGIVFGGSSALTILDSSTASAQPETTLPPPSKKPYAPIENLLPPTRVKVLIDRSVQVAKTLKSEGLSPARKEELLSELQNLLFEPRSFVTKQEASTAKRYLEVDTLSEWTKARRKETENEFFPGEGTASVDPLTRLNEGFEQWGERRQFRRLRKQQITLENSNPMRAAFNAYTNNLVFGDSYVLTADQSEKSRLIRQDRLPDVTSVIRSDLDLRDLFRNQILTAMDDARAELRYQLENETSLDVSELVVLLSQSQNACSKWFDFVPEADAKEAMDRVLAEDGI